MKILIKLATRSRPNKFVKVLQNIKQTTVGDYRLLISADSDDKTMNNPQMLRYLKSYPKAVIYFGNHNCKIEAINRDVEKIHDWDILVNMSDDFQIITRAWDNIIRQRVQSKWPGSLDFFAHFSDGYVHDRLPTISIMGRTYYERDGYIYHPSYKSFSCDAEAWYVAMARGCHCYFPDKLFRHNHPGNNRMLKGDVLYRINAIHSKDDVTNYFQRLNNDFELNLPGPHPWDAYKKNATTISNSNSNDARPRPAVK